MPMFWARTDNNSANNPSLNLTSDSATQITFVEPGTIGDLIFDTNDELILDTNGGAPDPNTQVEIGSISYDFTFELSGGPSNAKQPWRASSPGPVRR